MSKSKEIEWTVLFDFPPSNSSRFSYYPTINDEFKELEKPDISSLTDCKVWTNKDDATKYAMEKCGKYSWKLLATKVMINIEESKYKESINFTDDSFYMG